METCKTIMTHDMRDVGKTHKSRCTKPVYRDGLCKKHYTNYRRKMTPWGERRDYRVITLAEMQNGKYFKLKYSHTHKLLRLRTGVIQQYVSSTDSWIDTDFEINPEAYCVKIY
jgi:hypothetical protein